MNEILYVDLLIQGNDFVLNIGNEFELCNNCKSIGQDIIYFIIESGLVMELIVERSLIMWVDIFICMELLIEDDECIVLGIVEIGEESWIWLWIMVSIYDFGGILVQVDL